MQLYFSSPGFTQLKHTKKCGKVIHTASLCSQCFVLLICFFLLLRVSCKEQHMYDIYTSHSFHTHLHQKFLSGLIQFLSYLKTIS